MQVQALVARWCSEHLMPRRRWAAAAPPHRGDLQDRARPRMKHCPVIVADASAPIAADLMRGCSRDTPTSAFVLALLLGTWQACCRPMPSRIRLREPSSRRRFSNCCSLCRILSCAHGWRSSRSVAARSCAGPPATASGMHDAAHHGPSGTSCRPCRRRAAPAGRVPKRKPSASRRASGPPPGCRAHPHRRVPGAGAGTEWLFRRLTACLPAPGLVAACRDRVGTTAHPCGAPRVRCARRPDLRRRKHRRLPGLRLAAAPATRSCSPISPRCSSLRLVLVVGRLRARARSRHGRRTRALPPGADEHPSGALLAAAPRAFVGWFAFGWATVEVLGVLGFSPEARQVVAYALGLGLLAIAVDAVWRRPQARRGAGGAACASGSQRLGRPLSLYFVLLWRLWVAGLIGLVLARRRGPPAAVGHRGWSRRPPPRHPSARTRRCAEQAGLLRFTSSAACGRC